MAGTRIDYLGLLAGSVLARISALELQFESIERRQYPSEGPYRLARACLSICSAIVRDIDALELAVGEGAIGSDEAEIQLSRHGFSITYLHELMGLFEQAEIGEAPQELALPIQRLARELLPGSELILQASSTFNYTFRDITERIRGAFSSPIFSEALSQLPERLICCGIPRSESRNALMHAILAHEIGHGLYRQAAIADGILASVHLDEHELARMIDDLVQESLAQWSAAAQLQGAIVNESVMRQTIESALNRTLMEAIENWIEELACDVIGVLLVGPAMVLAFGEFAAPLAPRGVTPTSTHPPLDLRLRLMFEVLDPAMLSPEELANDSAVGALRRFLRFWDAQFPAGNDALLDPISRVVVRAVENSESAIIESCRTAVSSHAIDLQNLAGDLDGLTDRLSRLVPPNELPAPPTFRTMTFATVLNAGWGFRLAGFPRWKEEQGWLEKRSTLELNGLLLKAFELIEIVRWFETYGSTER